jgi:hypothetical protein
MGQRHVIIEPEAKASQPPTNPGQLMPLARGVVGHDGWWFVGWPIGPDRLADVLAFVAHERDGVPRTETNGAWPLWPMTAPKVIYGWS